MARAARWEKMETGGVLLRYIMRVLSEDKCHL